MKHIYRYEFCFIFAPKNKINPDVSLLAQEKGSRGRPTIEAKRQSELNPKRTLEQFWKETVANVPARFNLLDKEKAIKIVLSIVLLFFISKLILVKL